ncbi:MAG: permease-like cell division protein FtsX [Patescibacteria group bacterium]
MATTLARIIKYGFQSIWRNGWLSVASVNVMILALIVFNGLIVFSVLTDTAVASLQDKIDISVYFKSNAPEDEILKISRALQDLEEVKDVEYISQEKALEVFKERHKDDPTIEQALKELEENPLLASLNIKASDPTKYGDIAEYLSTENFTELIDEVTYNQSRGAIDRLNKIVNTVKRVGLGLTIFLALTAALVTFNTISLAIYSNREEIGIMRLVGASNAFINGPYLVEAIIFGIFSAVVSLIIVAPFVDLAAPYIQSFIPEMDLKNYFYSNLFNLFGYQLLFGIGLGVVSAAIAIRRYLKI